MNLMILVFVAFTVSYAALWHNKTSSSERDHSSHDQSETSDRTQGR